MKSFVIRLRKQIIHLLSIDRDARYVMTLLWAVPLFALSLVQAIKSGWFDSLETPIFEFFNRLPHWLGGGMYVITQLGSLGGMVLWVALAWYLINRRAAGSVFAAATLGWIVAKLFKTAVHRGRPQEFVDQINLFGNHQYSGYGFPSGHSTLVAACVTVLYFQLKPKYRKYLLLAALMVGISRMYLGAHFPLDVVGGWALGAICGAIVVLVAGVSAKTISSAHIKRVLQTKGYDIQSARFLKLDARGSRPIHIVDTDGHEYFGKIFGAQEHAADWLFKVYRLFRYKNLQAEEPYLNSRRNIELESFANLWAKKNGIRSPDIVDIVKVGDNWLLIQEKIDAKPLDSFGRLKQATLEDAWRQVAKMHRGNLAHRDLRAANLMVDRQGRAWIIDFGFAEVSPNKARKHMDIAELLMSMSLVAGVDRTLSAAIKVHGKTELRRVIPYVHRSVFSGATNQALRRNKDTLRELQNVLQSELAVKHAVKPADIDRLSPKKLLTIIFLAIFAYVIIPQFSEFKNAASALKDINAIWLVPLSLSSLLTYVAAAAVVVFLANVPLKLRDTTVVQVAASFMSKIAPGGVGATGLNMKYLVSAGMDTAEASALLIGQSVIGFVMFILPLLLTLLLAGQSLGDLVSIKLRTTYVVWAVILLGVATVIVMVNKKIRKKLTGFATTFATSLRDIAASPRELSLAAAASFSITIFYIGCLYASIHALGVHVSIIEAVLVYASAMVARAAVPTPGGLGAVEIAMSASLVGFGVPSAQAFAVVVLYRLATFWLPVPLSVWAYHYVSKRSLI